MRSRIAIWTLMVLTTVVLVLTARSASAAPPLQGDAERGAYIFAVNGGCGCHTREAGFLAGSSQVVEGPFGKVALSNITSDEETGIGGWTDQEIIDAIRLGQRPDGRQLFPIMPYMAFSGMSDQDVQDLVAYLRTVPPVKNQVPATELTAPMPPFQPPAPAPAVAPTEGTARGAYLVNTIALCGDCHTPRNPDGSPDMSRFLAGGFHPEFGLVPNITPDEETGIGSWSEEQLAAFMSTARKPDGTLATGMLFLVEGGYKEITPQDAQAMAAYLKSIPAVKNVPQAPEALPMTGGSSEGNGWLVFALAMLVGGLALLAGLSLQVRRLHG